MKTKTFSQKQLESQIESLKDFTTTCSGCDAKCQLTVQKQNGCWHPVIDKKVITTFIDENLTKQIVLSGTCNSMQRAFDLANKLTKLCDNYHQR